MLREAGGGAQGRGERGDGEREGVSGNGQEAEFGGVGQEENSLFLYYLFLVLFSI